VAVIFGLLSVWYAKKKYFGFPTGLVSTSIFVYLLWKWTLWGDMMINGYYFVMSIYGWLLRKNN
jgi:nicotinamide mononucleotide transporter